MVTQTEWSSKYLKKTNKTQIIATNSFIRELLQTWNERFHRTLLDKVKYQERSKMVKWDKNRHFIWYTYKNIGLEKE